MSPLLTNAQEQGFDSLGREQLTAHCSRRRNVECNNVSLWRVSHLCTLNVLCVHIGAVLTQRCQNQASNALHFLQASIQQGALNTARSPEIKDNI